MGEWKYRIEEIDIAPNRRDPIFTYEAIFTNPSVEWAIIGKGSTEKEAINNGKAKIRNSRLTLSAKQRIV